MRSFGITVASLLVISLKCLVIWNATEKIDRENTQSV